jgi:hypothetical protein
MYVYTHRTYTVYTYRTYAVHFIKSAMHKKQKQMLINLLQTLTSFDQQFIFIDKSCLMSPTQRILRNIERKATCRPHSKPAPKYADFDQSCHPIGVIITHLVTLFQ